MNTTTSSYTFMRLIKRIWNVLLLKTGKRISVGEYLLSWMYLTVISSLISLIVSYILSASWNFIVYFICSMIINLLVSVYAIILLIKRLHDLWKHWTHIFYLLIPLYNLIRIIKVTFSKWTVGENTYGADPLVHQPKSNKNYRLLRFLWFGISIVLWIITPTVMTQSFLDSELLTSSILEKMVNQLSWADSSLDTINE